MRDESPELLNYTGHPIVLTDGVIERTILPSGRVRVRSHQKMVERVKWEDVVIPILEVAEHEVVNAPTAKNGVLFIVSGLVQARSGRDDFVSPGRMTMSNGKARSAKALVRIGRK